MTYQTIRVTFSQRNSSVIIDGVEISLQEEENNYYYYSSPALKMLKKLRSQKLGFSPCTVQQVDVYSKFLKIELEDMVVGALLPVERFYQGDLWNDQMDRVQPRRVWNESRRVVNITP